MSHTCKYAFSLLLITGMRMSHDIHVAKSVIISADFTKYDNPKCVFHARPPSVCRKQTITLYGLLVKSMIEHACRIIVIFITKKL